MERGFSGRRLLAAVALAALCAGLGGAPAQARENYAIVVGVTDYPNLPKNNWLIGPRNDAIMVREYLTTRSPVKFDAGNVAILADDVEDAKEPTLASILSSLDAVAEKVESGDFLYLQFSGHGFQQTAADPSTETDGLDEIFLPKDTGRWVDRSKGMPNVLTDDAVGDALDRIRGKGAFVWVVFDACHSGTATRAAPLEDVQERKVDADALGMPAEVLTEGATTRDLSAREAPVEEIGSTGAAPAAEGGLVAFFAAQTNETTPEMPLPRGAENATRYGLFTHTIFSKLAENPNITYRQLAEGILQHYASINRTSTTPLFEGDLDAPVFGTSLDEFVPQWPITVKPDGVTVSGGLLNRLVPGSRLAIVEKPGDATEDAIGVLEVKSADNFSSRVAVAREEEPAAVSGTPEGKAKVRSLGDIPEGAYARLMEAQFDFTLTVAKPEMSDAYSDKIGLVDGILEKIAADDTTQLRIELVEPGAPADLRLAVLAESDLDGASFDASGDPALWFLPESGELSLADGQRPPSVVMVSDDQEAIGEAVEHYLTRVYRATNLARIGSASEYGADEIDVSFTLKRAENGEAVPISSTDLPTGVPGDRVSVRATNNTGTAVDINVLYVGSDYSITFMAKERLQPSATLDREFLEFTEDSYGRELMVAIVSEAKPLTPTLDLGFLAQDGLRSVHRGSGPESVADLIQNMGMGSATRAAKAVGGGGEQRERGAVLLYPMQTVPKS